MKNSSSASQFQLQASEVCAQLGISRDTLYAYVSRGLIRKVADPLDARKSLYHADDLQKLIARQKRPRARQDVASSTINWGEPVLQSAITEIRDEQLFYRGHSAVKLSQTKRFEEVFELLAGISFTSRKAKKSNPVPSKILRHKLPINRLMVFLAEEATQLGSLGGAQSARRIMSRAGIVTAGLPQTAATNSIAEALAQAWCPNKNGAAQQLNAALILCADHELNASAYAARVAASARANLGACLLAGIATLSGDAHGGATNLARDWEKKAATLLDNKKALSQFVTDNRPPGFGHPFYPNGDPRANELLRIANADKKWRTLIRDVHRIHGVWPTLDFGLAVLEDALDLPKGSGLGIFALGRMAGWIAHIFEQRKSGRLIRPRAIYSGKSAS